MSVNIKNIDASDFDSNIDRLLYFKAPQRMLAKKMAATAIESMIEMMSDEAGEYTSYSEVEAKLTDIQDVIIENAIMQLDDLKESLIHIIQTELKHRVETIKFSKEGFVDAEVFVE
jgi:hypothetical protein